MSGYSAHFSFDTFRGLSLKGVFLFSFLTVIIEDKPFHFGTTWPEVRPRCRSPPPFRFTPQKNRNGGTPYGKNQSAGFLPVL